MLNQCRFNVDLVEVMLNKCYFYLVCLLGRTFAKTQRRLTVGLPSPLGAQPPRNETNLCEDLVEVECGFAFSVAFDINPSSLSHGVLREDAHPRCCRIKCRVIANDYHYSLANFVRVHNNVLHIDNIYINKIYSLLYYILCFFIKQCFATKSWLEMASHVMSFLCTYNVRQTES